MRKLKLVLMVLSTVILIGILYFKGASKSGDNQPGQPEFQPQVNEQGGISFTVTPLEFSLRNPARFEVSIDTHSGSLDFDLVGISSLEDDKGNIYQPQEWQGSPSGGHHRSGILIFPKIDLSAKEIKLKIEGAGLPLFVFEWKIK